MFDLASLFGGLKSVNVELEKAKIDVNSEGFSLKFKPQTEQLPEKKEVLLIEEPSNKLEEIDEDKPLTLRDLKRLMGK